MRTVLDSAPPKPLPFPRSTATVAAELRRRAAAGELTLPEPGHGATGRRWSVVAELGRTDLTLARLAEGHTDALAILAEAGRAPVPDALYGVWAARTGGTGAELTRSGHGLRLDGTVRFCSGASVLDRALVAAAEGAGVLLVDVDLRAPGVHPAPESWPALGMDASDSLDVRFQQVEVDAVLGGPDWYTSRRGFLLGGGGVAAVWLGGAMGGYDRVIAALGAREPDSHALAHLGTLATALHAADALLATSAEAIDTDPDLDLAATIGLCRAAAERVGREICDLAPRITGPGPLCWDPAFAQHLADLGVYLRQHHGERDLAALGRHLVGNGEDR